MVVGTSFIVLVDAERGEEEEEGEQETRQDRAVEEAATTGLDGVLRHDGDRKRMINSGLGKLFLLVETLVQERRVPFIR